MKFEAAMLQLQQIALVGPAVVQTRYAITTPTLVSTRPGRVLRLSVVRAGTTPGAVHDADHVTLASSMNRTAMVPPVLGMTDLSGRPHEHGIVIVPGRGQMVAVAFC